MNGGKRFIFLISITSDASECAQQPTNAPTVRPIMQTSNEFLVQQSLTRQAMFDGFFSFISIFIYFPSLFFSFDWIKPAQTHKYWMVQVSQQALLPSWLWSHFILWIKFGLARSKRIWCWSCLCIPDQRWKNRLQGFQHANGKTMQWCRMPFISRLMRLLLLWLVIDPVRMRRGCINIFLNLWKW